VDRSKKHGIIKLIHNSGTVKNGLIVKPFIFYIFCLTLGIFGQSAAYITNIITWEKDGQKVIGCGDFHDPYKLHANVSQIRFLDDRLATLDPQNTCILVEDAQAYSGSDHQIAEYFKRWPLMLPQDCLRAMAQRHNPGLRLVNLEWRYAVGAALQPFIHDHKETPVRAHSVIQEFDEKVALVRSCNDGESLTKYYEEQISALTDKNEQVLDMIRQSTEPLTSWIRSHISCEKQIRFAKRLNRFGTPILDLIAIHEIVQRRNIQKFLIFAGAQHIDSIGRPLAQYLGFTKKPSIGPDVEVPYGKPSLDLNVLGSDAPPAGLLQKYTPLPAEKLAVLFE